MLDQLSPDQRALALAMSEVSQAAYCAGWMTGLEYALWHFLITGRRRYGKSRVTDDEIERLRALSLKCRGWIVFDDHKEEMFVPTSDWEQMFRSGIAKHLPFIDDDSDE
jgi:hypothetical protein